MGSDELFASAATLAQQVRDRDRTAASLVDDYLARIDSHDADVNAYVSLAPETARKRAESIDRALDAGDTVGPLAGLPIAIKDNIDVAGLPMTYGAIPLEDNVPASNDPLIDRLEGAGAIVLGKTNTPEFGYTSTTDNALFGPTNTPFDADHTAGGSSGGSAAAVAHGLAAFAHGSDGGGSIRIPAACCGVYGFKPSFGRVPDLARPDGFGHASQFRFLGPLTRTVEDAALAMSVMAGPHSRDPYSLPDDGTAYIDALGSPVSELSVAYSPGLDMLPVDPRVSDVIEGALSAVETAGMAVDHANPTHDIDVEALGESFVKLFSAKFAATAERIAENTGFEYLGADRDRASPGLPEMMEFGMGLSAVDVRRANERRTEWFEAVQALLETYDLLVSPTITVPPPPLGVDGIEEVDGESIDPNLGWLLTWQFNLCPHPGASIPAGFVDGLPVGMQLIGRQHADDTVLAASAAFEAERPWRNEYPGIAT